VQVFTLGGSFSGPLDLDKGGEVFDGTSWSKKSNILGASILSSDPQGAFRTDNYGFFFAWTGNSGVCPLSLYSSGCFSVRTVSYFQLCMTSAIRVCPVACFGSCPERITGGFLS
jgi:hypothetical protein